jgi:four helix bundle protein
MQAFDHERLEVYQVALDFVVLANEVANSVPEGHGALGDQLRRASTSIVLNIAEGAGEFSKKEKARFYRMASRSATECAGVLDICRKLQLAEEKKLLAGRVLLLRIVSMLIRLVAAIGETGKKVAGSEKRGPGGNESRGRPGTGTGTGTGTGKKQPTRDDYDPEF